MFFFRHKTPAALPDGTENDNGRRLRKPACVMHPKNAPRTIKNGMFPKKFHHYAYAGAMLDVVSVLGPQGKIVRRPALVARMRYRFSPTHDGFMIELDMTASVRDLLKARHPHAASIAAALTAYYEEKVPVREPAFSRSPVLHPKQTHAAQAKTANDFFSRLNGPLSQEAPVAVAL
ncbi:MAG: hypothetical protein PHS57_08085 [Alphaproteobacteria bacterium]|nr:hypothetical protein [Alphaproteobacteria bacterium]